MFAIKENERSVDVFDIESLGSRNSLDCCNLHDLWHDSPELVVSVDVPGGDAHQLVQVRCGGGHQVHAGAVDVHLVEDALPGDLGPQEAPTLERELTSFIPVTRKIESVTKLCVGCCCIEIMSRNLF